MLSLSENFNLVLTSILFFIFKFLFLYFIFFCKQILDIKETFL